MVNEAVREEVIEVVRRINAAWLEGHVDELESLMHPDVSVVHKGFARRSIGVHAAIDGYREFAEGSEIRDFRESEHVVDSWGDTAVATYHFEMDYEQYGEAHHDSGFEILVLVRVGDGWQAVWRSQVPDV